MSNKKNDIMTSLIIDNIGEKIFLKIISGNKEYINKVNNCRENFDELVKIIFNFLDQNNINLSKIDNIFINQGPGKFSGIRTSIAVAKALCITNKLSLYGFNSNDLKDMNYNNVVDLYEKGVLTKNLINPGYSS